MSSVLEQLQALEVELHHPGVRCTRARLEQLLHPEFHEVGRSGQQYSRSTVIEFLQVRTSIPQVLSERFDVVELHHGVALLTYRSAHVGRGGQLSLHTLRASVWTLVGDVWQQRYHQGTPAAEPW